MSFAYYFNKTCCSAHYLHLRWPLEQILGVRGTFLSSLTFQKCSISQFCVWPRDSQKGRVPDQSVLSKVIQPCSTAAEFWGQSPANNFSFGCLSNAHHRRHHCSLPVCGSCQVFRLGRMFRPLIFMRVLVDIWQRRLSEGPEPRWMEMEHFE